MADTSLPQHGRMLERVHDPLLLVLGILPSDATVRGGRQAAQRIRHGAMQTWLQHATSDIVARFVYAAPSADSGKRWRRRRLALPSASPSEQSVTLQTPNDSVCSCAELTLQWFAHALEVWPSARFYGKTEDDVMISLPALRFEVSRLAPDGRLWWGLMAWTGNGDVDHPRVGCWAGGFEDDPVLTPKGVRGTLGKERACPDGARPVAPSPTHEIDIRSGALARDMASCTYPRAWLLAMGRGRRCPNDCAAVQGHWLTRCLTRNVTLAHATWSKVHSNSLDNGWRPFAPPSNLTVVLDMNLGDKVRAPSRRRTPRPTSSLRRAGIA